MNCKILAAALLSLISLAPACAHCYPEKIYQSCWCKINNGQTEARLNDKTRVDCLTEDYAIEFDFAKKWAESIGQALYYADCTGKKAGVVLIIENPQTDYKYLSRLKTVALKYNIKVWTITPQDICISNTVRN